MCFHIYIISLYSYMIFSYIYRIETLFLSISYLYIGIFPIVYFVYIYRINALFFFILYHIFEILSIYIECIFPFIGFAKIYGVKNILFLIYLAQEIWYFSYIVYYLSFLFCPRADVFSYIYSRDILSFFVSYLDYILLYI